MLRYAVATVCLLAFAVAASAQQFDEDVVYLRNGSIVRGVITELVVDEYVKIRIQGGSLMVFEMVNVLKITKEPRIAGKVPKVLERKSPGTAFLYSFLFVGCGQVYNDQDNKAFAHWLILVGALYLIYQGEEDNVYGRDLDGDDHMTIAGTVLGLSNWVASMGDAYESAKKINEEIDKAQGVSGNGLILEPYVSRDTRGAMLSFRF